MAQVVILGGGFAGLGVARALGRSRAKARLDVTLVNRENYMLFTPMLPEVASGSVEPRHIGQPIRSALRGRIRFVLANVTGVDFQARRVHMEHPLTGVVNDMPYDHLVIALGAESSTHGTPGAQDHSTPLKTLDDAVCIRSKLVHALEAAAVASDDAERRRLLTLVVVGGGFTGVEAVGELLAYLRAVGEQYPAPDREVRVVLVAGSGRLLEQLPKRFGDRAQAMLSRRGIEVVLNDDVAAVDAGGLTLKSGKRYEASTIVWSAGVRIPPLIAELDVTHSEHHAIVVQPDMSVEGRSGVWSLGDCAHIPKPGGGAFPQTAQHAIREASVLARNIIAVERGRPTRSFRYKEAGMMASLGGREGLADIAGRAMISGFPAWLMWRGYYLSQLPGAYRKVRVAADWALALPFAKDVTSID